MQAISIVAINQKFLIIAKSLNHAETMFNEFEEIPLSMTSETKELSTEEMKNINLTPEMCDVLSNISFYDYFIQYSGEGLIVATINV